MKLLLRSLAYILSCLTATLIGQDPQALAVHYKAVVFDFGGVVAKADRQQMSEFLTNSLGISESELQSALLEMRERVVQGEPEIVFWQKYALGQGKSLQDDWSSRFEAVIKMSIKEIPGTIAIVKDLQKQGYQTAMLSDVTQYQAQVLHKLGYYDLFRPVLLSYKIGVEKPDPKAFEILLTELKLPASAVIFIDDKLLNIEAAQKLGIDGIVFTSPEQLTAALASRGITLTTIESPARGK